MSDILFFRPTNLLVRSLIPAFLVLFTLLLYQAGRAQVSNTSSVQWVTFTDCPVILENRYIVPARDSGVVDSVAVQLNQAIERGQLLLSLEKNEAQWKLEEAKANHQTAVALAADDSDLEVRKIALEQAEDELTKYTEISKSVSATELKRLKLETANAKANVKKAQLAFQRLGTQVALTEIAVQAASLRLANREVHAPAAGIVSELKVRPGQWIDVGKPVMEILDLQQLQVDCLVPIEKTDLKKLVGLEVRVESNHRSASGAPIRLGGKITSYDPKVTARGEVRVHCRIQNAQQDGHWLLLPDMNVRLEVGVPTQARGEVPALISRRPK